MSTSLKLNMVASFASRVIPAIVSVLLVPLYIHYLGMESYGLIGIYTTLYGMLAVLDMGLSASLNRRLAQLSVQPGTGGEQRNLLRTLEIIYWAMALAIGLLFLVLAPILSHWVNPGSLSLTTITAALALMGMVFIFQFPFALYQGGMMGLQWHIPLNVIVVTTSLLRAVGSVAVLAWISSTIEAFFVWQCFCSALQTLILWRSLWSKLPTDTAPPRFSRASLLTVGSFAAGMTGIAAASIVLKSMDKLVLSKVLPLDEFGYYMVGTMVATSISTCVGPFFMTAFPRFSELLASERLEEAKNLYHLLCQMATCVVIPIVVVIALFSQQILYIWSRNPDLVDHSSVYVSLLVIGTGMNALLQVPYAFQLAHGATAIAFYQAVISTILFIPLLLFLIHYFSAVGGALTWIFLTGGYILITPHIMHRTMLPTEKWTWYVNDIIIPTLGISAISGVAWYLVPINRYNVAVQFLMLGAIWCVAVLAGMLSAPNVRRRIFLQCRKWIGIRNSKVNCCE